jgi:hypothetical protein
MTFPAALLMTALALSAARAGFDDEDYEPGAPEGRAALQGLAEREVNRSPAVLAPDQVPPPPTDEEIGYLAPQVTVQDDEFQIIEEPVTGF